MAEIRYRRRAGEPEDVAAFGRTFEHGKFVDVDDVMVARVRGNPMFEIKGEDFAGEDDEGRETDDGPDARERRQRATIQRAGQAETQKARQAEAKAGG